MSYDGAYLLASAFKSIGINAEVSPDSCQKTLEYGAKYTCGDECYPQMVTLGNFMKVIKDLGKKPKEVAFFMPTAGGPCRFGQYSPFLKKILKENGFDDALVLSPSSGNGYEGLSDHADDFTRTVWRALLCGDIARKLLLATRPYEINKGDTEKVYHESLADLDKVFSQQNIDHKKRFTLLQEALKRTKKRFKTVKANFTKDKPLIGIVGEIFCRLNDFSNDFLVKKIEELGGEAWMSDVAEWILYTKNSYRRELKRTNKKFTKEYLVNEIKIHVQHKEEKALFSIFKDEFRGYEEPKDVQNILDLSKSYLHYEGALGEMVLSIGKAIYYNKKGADGVIDISPFTCMNGIVTESIFPRVSSDYNQFPIKNFYFDGTKTDLDRDIGIFLELARLYKQEKKNHRVYPKYFL